jgi:hypothetical protein
MGDEFAVLGEADENGGPAIPETGGKQPEPSMP